MATLRTSFAVGANLCLMYGMARGLDGDELCASAGFSAGDLVDAWRIVPGEWSERLWATLVQRLPRTDVGLELGQYARLEHFGPAGEMLRHAGSGRDFLRSLGRFANLIGLADSAREVQLIERVDRTCVILPQLSEVAVEQAEAWTVFIVDTLQRLSPLPVRPCLVQYVHAYTPRRAAAVQHHACDVEWGGGEHAIWFESSALRAAWPRGNRAIAQRFERWVDERLLGPARSQFALRAQVALERAVATGDPSQRSAARALGLSVRSFQRRLQREGLDYGALLAAALRAVGTPLMRDSSRSILEVALGLGYSDVSSFGRAWKRLTGESPARYRARLSSPGTDPLPHSQEVSPQQRAS